MNTKPITQTLS